MPTINKRFLLKLVLVLLASSTALIAVHAVQSRRIPAALKAQSERAAEQGKLDTAIHYLRQYLEFHPDDVDSQIQLAQWLEQRLPTSRNWWDLLFLHDRILRLDPNRHDIRRKALAIGLKLGRYTDAVTHAEYLLKTFPTEPELWQQLGAAQAGLNELAAARQSYENAILHAPDQLLGYQRLAQLAWRNMNDAVAARDVLNRMVRALPHDADAYLIRARFEVYTADDPGVSTGQGGDLAQARRDLHRVLELDPEHAEASLLLAEIMQRQRNIPAAHALLRDAVSLYPRNIKLIRALSWLELVRGNTAAAITVLEDGVKAVPHGLDLMVPLADLMVQQGDTTRTAEILVRLQHAKAPPTQVKYLQARMAMREQKWAEALTLLENLRRDILNMPGLEMQLNLLSATCHQKLGDPDAEEKAYQRVTNADPTNVIARVGLGNLYMNLGRFDDAARELEMALKSPFATGVVVSQYVRLKSRIILRSARPGDWLLLERDLNANAHKFPRGSSEPVILRAEMLVLQGQLNDAVKFLRKESAMRPNDGRLWAALALTTADLQGVAAGLAILDEAQTLVGDGTDVRLARALLYAREPGRIRPIAPLGEKIDAWPETEQLRLLAGLVEVYDQINDQPRLIQTLRRLLSRQPNNVAMWRKMYERAAPTDDAAREARAALVKLEGEQGPSVLLCDARGPQPHQYLARLIQTFGENPSQADACLALARCRDAAGDPATAAALVQRAFRLEPTRYETVEALLLHSAKSRDMGRIQALLEQLASDPRWAGEPFRRVVGRVLPQVPTVAVDILNACRPLLKGDPQARAWVADCAIQLQHPETAQLLDKATQLPTSHSDDWLRKALFVAQTDPAAGAAVLAAAQKQLPPAEYLSLVAVYTESSAGRAFVPRAETPEQKKRLVQAQLAVKLSCSQTASAGRLLEDFLADKTLPAHHADWARRNLAMIYAVGGTPDDRVRAMKLLREVATDTHTSVDELRATVTAMTALARYLEGPDRREALGRAIHAMQAIHQQTQAHADLFGLSQLYRAANNRAASRQCLQQLLNRPREELEKDPSYTFYLTTALEELVEDGNFAAAEAFAGRLLQLRVNDFSSLATIARMEAKAGRAERALTVAEDYARWADAAAGDYLTRSAQVAELLDELSRLPNVRGTAAGRQMTTAAAERFAALVPNRPDAIVGVVGALASDGRVAEAFEQIERFHRYLSLRLRAAAGLAIVRAGHVTDQQAEVVERWLSECLAAEPEAIVHLLNKAEFHAHRGDTASAATLLRKVLAQQPHHVVALNNLAWMLAADATTAAEAMELVNRATRERGLTGDLLDTRARIRITLKQLHDAEADLAEAISHQPTALRWFHVALLRMNQSPTATEQAKKAFAEAQRRGLDQKMIHPADLPTYRILEAAIRSDRSATPHN
ncbi:MAG: tetratricopeptide repeat protein [Gemmataceae bacterium]|nr:tetratricopeptide repeat protein [Gemmata sp.]MDW8196774.1 tetratricopeptide repeat protein [Gemmataceae bacterium]